MANLKRNEGESDESYYKRRAAKDAAYKMMIRGHFEPTEFCNRKERRSKEFKAKLSAYRKHIANAEEKGD